MSKVAIVVLTDIEGGEALGRVVNALTAAQEFRQGGDDVEVVFTGAGTRWIGELEKPENQLHGLYSELKDHIAGACGYCAGAFGVTDAVRASGLKLLEDYGPNMSYRQLLSDGYQVLTF
ncbi:MAG: DsrE family protein [Maioricimonas sp. JB045]|uniref:DsrE family protein n=1 Tax=Maioricimonas sp. JC845 TaxID=3232138 RepID=UPI00345B4678